MEYQPKRFVEQPEPRMLQFLEDVGGLIDTAPVSEETRRNFKQILDDKINSFTLNQINLSQFHGYICHGLLAESEAGVKRGDDPEEAQALFGLIREEISRLYNDLKR